jgi:ABC-type glycerol-3-phosphate transport system substrate-binding protein
MHPGGRRSSRRVTTGVVPDLFQNNPPETTALFAWEDKLVDVSDVVEPQHEEYADTALALVNCYNSVEKKRGIYGVPYTIDVFTNHIWRPLVEKAGESSRAGYGSAEPASCRRPKPPPNWKSATAANADIAIATGPRRS